MLNRKYESITWYTKEVRSYPHTSIQLPLGHTIKMVKDPQPLNYIIYGLPLS